MSTYQYPSLTPVTSLWMQETLKNKSMLRDLFEQYGSPINLHNLECFEANYKIYASVFESHQLKYGVFFARKANKCRAFARQASRLGFGVDTASYRELKQCLELGCDPDKLVLTAAVKDEELVRLALKNEVLMVLDNEDECERVNRLAGELDKTPVVGIRISGFRFEGKKLYSRFGFDIDDAAEFITNQTGPDRPLQNLRFGGFHFHLDGYSIEQRVAALMQTLTLVDTLEGHQIATSFIDMGGGLLTNYLADKNEWDLFWTELKKAAQGRREPITFGNNGLGYSMTDSELRGDPNVYPFYNETPKEHFLEAILSSKGKEGVPVASLVSERDIELRIEPGRSLLDQTGMTLARVAHRKQDQRGDWLVGLEMNRSQLSSSSDDFLLDPILISMQQTEMGKQPTAVYFTGAYCLEQDIILKRKIVLPHLPEIGDIIAFINTAGYMMHFYETHSHLHAFTTNLIQRNSTDFIRDEEI